MRDEHRIDETRTGPGSHELHGIRMECDEVRNGVTAVEEQVVDQPGMIVTSHDRQQLQVFHATRSRRVEGRDDGCGIESLQPTTVAVEDVSVLP